MPTAAQAQIAEKVQEIWELRQSLAEDEAKCRDAQATERAADAAHRAKKCAPLNPSSADLKAMNPCSRRKWSGCAE